jgi:hypothetical protein
VREAVQKKPEKDVSDLVFPEKDTAEEETGVTTVRTTDGVSTAGIY